MPTETPRDLIRLAEVMERRGKSRTWWSQQINAGRIRAYRLPGERGLWLSQADVDELLQPQEYKPGVKEA